MCHGSATNSPAATPSWAPRRQVYDSGKLGKENRRKDERWFNFAPERVATADPGTVYHFLLPDPGMANYRNKAAKRYEADNFKRIKEWQRAFCQPFTADEITELEALSVRVDELWALHTEQLTRDRRETEDSLPVWGRASSMRPRHTANDWKDRIRAQGVFSQGTRTVGPYRRLKLVMDYWCALWFWPIGQGGQTAVEGRFFERDQPGPDEGRSFNPAWGRTRPRISSAKSTPSTPTKSPNASPTRSGCWILTSCSNSSRA